MSGVVIAQNICVFQILLKACHGTVEAENLSRHFKAVNDTKNNSIFEIV
jgi:hypothetical protein